MCPEWLWISFIVSTTQEQWRRNRLLDVTYINDLHFFLNRSLGDCFTQRRYDSFVLKSLLTFAVLRLSTLYEDMIAYIYSCDELVMLLSIWLCVVSLTGLLHILMVFAYISILWVYIIDLSNLFRYIWCKLHHHSGVVLRPVVNMDNCMLWRSTCDELYLGSRPTCLGKLVLCDLWLQFGLKLKFNWLKIFVIKLEGHLISQPTYVRYVRDICKYFAMSTLALLPSLYVITKALKCK